MSERIAVGISTYRRPELLDELLVSLRRDTLADSLAVYVVDNDPEASARSVAERHDDFLAKYVVEPEAGIAQARNRFLDELADEELLVFIDDDERVDPGWMRALLSVRESSGADVVWGPVIPEFPHGAPRWAVDGGFFDRARHETGARLALAATNNVLVRRSALDSLARPRFDTSFSVTGGSDSDLFNRMVKNGAVIVWCDEAIVRERVPDSRMTWVWVRRRAERTGNVRARLLLQDGRRVRVLVEGLARIAVGASKLSLRKVAGRPADAWSLNPFMRGLGMIRALRGQFVQEYRRTSR